MFVQLKASKTYQFRRTFRLVLAVLRRSLCLMAKCKALSFAYMMVPPLTRSSLSDFIQKKTVAAGWTGDFATHSVRIGAASTAAMLDIPHCMIKALGIWSSDVYQLYISLLDERLAGKLGNVLTN